MEFARFGRPVHAWQSGQRRKEELIVERYPMLGSGRRASSEHNVDEIASYGIGDLYVRSFSTSSPPAAVTVEYIVTRKDKEGLWGRPIQGEVEEYTLEDME